MEYVTPPLLHIGYPKTATTWLQKNLFLPRFGFQSALNHAHIQLGIVGPSPFTYSAQNIRIGYEMNLQKSEMAADTVPVVSSEVLSGNTFLGGYNAKQNADRLYEAFPHGKVMMVTREQSSYVRALYKTQVEWGMPHKLKHLLDPHKEHRFPQFGAHYLRYELVAQYYIQLFGAENVLVIPYELLVNSPDVFLQHVVEFSGVQTDITPLIEKSGAVARVNANKPISAIAFQRWFNAIFISNAMNYSGMFRSEKNEGAYAIRGKLDWVRLPSALNERMEKKFREAISEYTLGKFEQSNQQLQALCRYDLAELGYAL